ncbi:hypothetical protein ACEPAF_1847 [Sanghuangporus sanghuang]
MAYCKAKRQYFDAEESTGRSAQIENNTSPDDDDVRMQYYDEYLGFSILGSRKRYSSYLRKPQDTKHYSETPDYAYMMDLDRLIFSVIDEAFYPLDNISSEDDGIY